MTASAPLTQLIRDIRLSLHHLKERGCTGFDCTPQSLETLKNLGWSVIRVWEHEAPSSGADRVVQALKELRDRPGEGADAPEAPRL